MEKALYAAKLPGLTPQRTDARTILLPVSQPTVESRNSLLSGLQKQAEETRVAIRKVHQTSQKHLKTIGFDHRSPAANDVSSFFFTWAMLIYATSLVNSAGKQAPGRNRNNFESSKEGCHKVMITAFEVGLKL